MHDQLHKPATAVAREPDAGAPCHSWAADHVALHLSGWLTIEQQDQLVAEHNSRSLGDDHHTARFDLRDADSATVDRFQPHFESVPGRPIVTLHVGDTVIRHVSVPSRPSHVAELVLRTGDALVALAQSGNATMAAHFRTADPRTGLLCQHLTVTIWTSG